MVSSSSGKSVMDLPPDRQTSNGDSDFDISELSLESLEGCPKLVKGAFYVNDNKLRTLVGGPLWVGAMVDLTSNTLTSLDGIPAYIGGSLILDNNHTLTSLRGVNQVKTLGGSIIITDTPITSHILGVFFISGCDQLYTTDAGSFGRAADIVNAYLHLGRSGLLQCTTALIESDLADYAQI
jgi:hypothetical protein